jgi:hypothetical protein
MENALWKSYDKPTPLIGNKAKASTTALMRQQLPSVRETGNYRDKAIALPGPSCCRETSTNAERRLWAQSGCTNLLHNDHEIAKLDLAMKLAWQEGWLVSRPVAKETAGFSECGPPRPFS